MAATSYRRIRRRGELVSVVERGVVFPAVPAEPDPWAPAAPEARGDWLEPPVPAGVAEAACLAGPPQEARGHPEPYPMEWMLPVSPEG